MPATYVRRFRMELDLANLRIVVPELPDGFRWIPWHPTLNTRHARVKYLSFRHEPDARLFRCLSDFAGCYRLMSDITSQSNFTRQATWLLVRDPDDFQTAEDVGTIQGMSHSDSLGAIQNVGIHPEFRGMGLGRSLVLKALDGFRRSRMKRVVLEVTASNRPAVDLYRSVGFRLIRTTFKELPEEALIA